MPSADVLEAMEQALNGLRMLLDSLLDVSRLDAGLIVANPVTMPISNLMERLAAEYAPRTAAQGLGFRVVGCRAMIRSDPVLLERVLRNLVENALRYTKRGGLLVGCRRRGDRLRVAVVDTGIGIPPERQAEIFEEFFQIGNVERDRTKGLGLGLAVVRRLTHLLGHQIDVCSVPGRGSVFAIEVPLVASVRLQKGEGGAIPTLDGTGLVLVIDDEALVRLGMKAMIEGWGYQVLTAGSVDEAIRISEEGHRPTIILADYRLRGGETGLDAINALNGRLHTRIPAAIVTGDTAPERLVEAKAGGHWLLHKPVTSGELRKVIGDLLGRARGDNAVVDESRG